jgi:hypothetical protein
MAFVIVRIGLMTLTTEPAMPLLPKFHYAMFDPETTRLMGEAFDLAQSVLAFPPPLVVQECMANRIVEAARHGERDLKRLRDAAFGAPNIAPD